MNRSCVLLLVSAALFLGGCATDTPKSTDPQRVSTMPWNNPQPGEGAGAMGSMINTR
ncbi:MAG: hypothetical protein WCH57_08150 [Verrucomicrobiota bacterium]